ncbi:33 kDa chaperonin [Thiomicrorhabdus immobilis]|uniref:33 kDa chaperonin n=1 Tax=Thiomicrorhabdus immobilis TaxID=2791037 RepID=A0ABM7MBZ9_9GAMM|nr:Hsp33 family molecular chaperone HslO [Thiomicrorhabdus immobilis]BCN92866.1 33 kDa chaperonin [Thiomicrorhabdus immobilis]
MSQVNTLNAVQRFLFKELNIRGQHIQLQQSWQKMIEERHYPPAIIKLLGELTAMSVLMANGMKHEGRITLQVQGSGPITLLVVDVTHDLKIRGVAKTNQAITTETTLDELLGDGQILMTLENTQTQHHFQSYVPREGDTVAEAFETFLSQSEQLPSKIWLAADETSLGGVMIQKMPETDGHDEDGWDRILQLTTTVKDEELTTLPAEELLHRLFHEEVLELFTAEEVAYECPKDEERVTNMLKSLGEAEVRHILEEQGEIVIHNEMCNFHMRFNKEDIDALFAEEKPTVQ